MLPYEENKMVVSVVNDREIRYPLADDYYSPDEPYPEYKVGHVSKIPNQVYSAVRRCFADAGLDSENFGKETWNPLGAYISPGNRVFLLCNFVEQKVGEITDEMFFAKCTHGAVIRAVIDYVMIALRGEGYVSYGNAPLQSCDWNTVIEQTGALKIQKFFKEVCRQKIEVKLVDLRQQIIRRNTLGGVRTDFYKMAADCSVEVNLAEKSLLNNLYENYNAPKFRVLDYDSRRTASCHDKGKHVYYISPEIIGSDVVVSIPKLKTHEKVGLTCGIKGCVGVVAHKDCLAHHRYGPPRHGGDEYPDSLSPLKVISAIHDSAYKMEPGLIRDILHAIDYFTRKVIRQFHRALSGSWPGNDTCWRMAVDLARILEYADKTGDLCKDKQRTHLLLTDGIIGGEGDGPLSPKPVPLGYLCFSDNVIVGDYVNALAVGFSPSALPIIREGLLQHDYPLFGDDVSEQKISVNGKVLNIGSFNGSLGRKFLPPKEWRRSL